MDPNLIFRNNLVDLPDDKKDSIHSFWLMTFSVFNKKQQQVLQKTIVLGLAKVSSIGIGIENQASASTPVYLFNAITKAISLLSPAGEEIEYLDAKVPTSYTTDNYWMPFIHNQPRILFDTTKKFIAYNYANRTHLLRTPTAVLNKINIRDKNLNSPYKKIISLIKKNRMNAYSSEYYQVLQHLRDVKNDHSYNMPIANWRLFFYQTRFIKFTMIRIALVILWLKKLYQKKINTFIQKLFLTVTIVQNNMP